MYWAQKREVDMNMCTQLSQSGCNYRTTWCEQSWTKTIIWNLKHGFHSVHTLDTLETTRRFGRPWYKSVTAHFVVSFSSISNGIFFSPSKRPVCISMHKRVPWHLQLSLSTQAQFSSPHPPCLWGALSSWQPCGSLWRSLGTLGYLFLHGAAEGKDTRLSLKRKKNKKTWLTLKGSCSDSAATLNKNIMFKKRMHETTIKSWPVSALSSVWL